MNEINVWMEKIDKYLNREMSRDEQVLFEAELATNEELTTVFNVYRTVETEMPNDAKFKEAEIQLKESLSNLNNKYFSREINEPTKIIPLVRRKIFRYVSSIAASIITILIGYFSIFYQIGKSLRIAKEYIEINYSTLQGTMDQPDSLQLAIDAYNNGEFNKAVRLFDGVYQNHPQIYSAIEYEGLAYLRMNDYDNALLEFDKLANIDSLHSNPGKFLKAITLMRRNKGDDKDSTKLLLQEVVKDELEGNKKAEEWLRKYY